jgi:disulfide oxidoreductase YuzD
MSRDIKWLDEPEHHDYTAALSYLSLHFPMQTAGDYVHALRLAEPEQFKAKDIARASGLPILDEKNSHVEHVLEKIEDGKKLSPILLVRMPEKLLIADGYHRVSAVHLHDEDSLIPCRIV